MALRVAPGWALTVILAVIQARLGSMRLPQKSLMDICGKPLIQHVIERAEAIRGVDRVVLAVPYGEAEDFARFAETWDPDVPEMDVLARFAQVVAHYPEADPIMRVCGDCPLFDPGLAEQVLALYQAAGVSYAWNVTAGYVDGTDCEVFSRAALLEAHQKARSAFDREHVTPYIRRFLGIATLPAPPRQGPLKTSVDTQDELDLVRRLCQMS